MSALLTKNFKILMAKRVYDLLDLTANSYLPDSAKSYIYVTIGKPLPWNSGIEVPPTPKEDDESINEYYRRGIYAKQLSLENASLVVPRINWVANTIYSTYLSTENFYVLNKSDQVFKCLSNVATNTASTVEPTLTLSTTSLEEPYILTSDGYKWKYMNTLTSQQKQKFLSDDWMPITYNKFVRAAAVGGSIDVVTINNSGNNYTNGTVQSIITVTGDGTGAILKANVAGGHVQDIIIQNRGSNYTYANVAFTDVSGGIGSDASATISIAPHDGHGYDPEYELGASTIIFNVEFTGDESGKLPTENDFREITLLQNPFNQGTTKLATDTFYTMYTRIKTSPGVGDYNNDEIVFQGTTFADATFSAEVVSFDEIQNYLYLNNIHGTLQNNQAIKGLSSGSIRVVNSIVQPTLDLFSGKILYIADKLPISRDPSQTERIRFIMSF